MQASLVQQEDDKTLWKDNKRQHSRCRIDRRAPEGVEPSGGLRAPDAEGDPSA
jgi:hypothetical protein